MVCVLLSWTRYVSQRKKCLFQVIDGKSQILLINGVRSLISRSHNPARSICLGSVTPSPHRCKRGEVQRLDTNEQLLMYLGMGSYKEQFAESKDSGLHWFYLQDWDMSWLLSWQVCVRIRCSCSKKTTLCLILHMLCRDLFYERIKE